MNHPNNRACPTGRRLSLLVLSFLVPGLAADQAAWGQVDWTILVYLDGDNNLEPAAIDDFLEMATVGSNQDVQILALFDRAAGWDNTFGNWTDTRRGLVSQNDVPSDGTDGNPAWGVSIGEANMGDPQTLVDFVEWGMQNHPASNYAVVLWDHGSGWREREGEEPPPFKFVCDDSDDGAGGTDTLFMREVRDALETIETDEQEPDLVGFDACLMGMIEVAYEIREHASVMVGSEKMEPNDGWPYDTILADLVANPAMSASGLGSTVVSRYYEFHGGSETQSAVDLSAIDSLAARVDSFAEALRQGWSSDAGACLTAAYQVMMAVDSAVIAAEPSSSASHGLAIYFPEDSGDFSTDYNDTVILFPGATRWEEFLLDFHASMAGSWIADARDQCQDYDASAAAGHQGWHADLYDFCEKVRDDALDEVIWVDFAYGGPFEFGTFDYPYDTLAEALAAAGAGETIVIKQGSSAETPTISTAVTLRGYDGGVTVGQ